MAIDDEKTDPAIPRPSVAEPPPAPPPVIAPIAGPMPIITGLEPFMKDPEVTEIMVNDLRNVMIEKNGRITYSGFSYRKLDELNQVTNSILEVTGRTLGPDHPYVDVMLADGSRVNIVGPPLTPHGPCLTIRKFPSRRLTLENLVQREMLDRKMAQFLAACVLGKMNLLISGGTGSGKTTLLNALAGLIPQGERVITIEEMPELALSHANSVKLQTKAQTPTSPAVTARDLAANALRMRPDRILIGECRRGEAFDIVQAMNTGHEGSMTTLHANSARDALSRLETLCLLGGVELPLLAIRKQIASSLDLVVQTKRFRDSRRRVLTIAEVTGMEGDVITLQNIFEYDSGGAGRFACTGLVPSFMDRLRDQGVELANGFFG